MNRGICVQMMVLYWFSSGLLSVMHTPETFSLSYCELNKIQQIFCDIPHLLVITCSKNITAEIVLILVNAVLDFCCFMHIIISSSTSSLLSESFHLQRDGQSLFYLPPTLGSQYTFSLNWICCLLETYFRVYIIHRSHFILFLYFIAPSLIPSYTA